MKFELEIRRKGIGKIKWKRRRATVHLGRISYRWPNSSTACLCRQVGLACQLHSASRFRRPAGKRDPTKHHVRAPFLPVTLTYGTRLAVLLAPTKQIGHLAALGGPHVISSPRQQPAHHAWISPISLRVQATFPLCRPGRYMWSSDTTSPPPALRARCRHCPGRPSFHEREKGVGRRR
jgi:hypothetical protein